MWVVDSLPTIESHPNHGRGQTRLVTRTLFRESGGRTRNREAGKSSRRKVRKTKVNEREWEVGLGLPNSESSQGFQLPGDPVVIVYTQNLNLVYVDRSSENGKSKENNYYL